MAVGAATGTYRRPVSPTECWFLVYPPSVPGVIQVFVEGEGAIDHAALTAAVRRAADACPGSRLTRRGMEWVDSGLPPVVRTGLGGSLDHTRFADEPALHVPLMGDGGPTCEVLLLDGAPATVVFRAFHGAMDGKGVLLWAEDVFRALRGERPAGADSALTETDLLAKTGVPGFEGPTPDLNWPSCLGARPPRGGGFLWRRRSVDGNHSALVAKIATVITADSGLGTGRFMVPVDLRRHAPGERTTGNLLHNPLIEVTAGRPWEDAHERLLRTLADGGDLAARAEPSLPSVPLATLKKQIMALDEYSAKIDRYSALATISHMGRLDLAGFTAPGFRPTTVYALPNSGPLGPPEIDLCEVEGRTEITLGWYDGPGIAERAEALLDRIEEALSPRAHREWAGNLTHRPVDTARTVVHRFAEQAARTPDAVALTGPEGEVSYRELAARAAAVTAELARRGVGRESVVGLLADRTVDAVAAIWGILGAGAGYLPLDPHFPDRRLADLLGDAGSTLCLIERGHAGRDCLPAGCERLVLGDPLPPAAPPAPAAAPGPGDLAYIIYTSGSTGAPKGVEVEHGALTTFADWAARVYGVSQDTRFPLFTSLAFDLSNTALFVPLLVGGSIALVPGETSHVVLREMLEDSGCTAIKLTPTHLDLIGRLGIEPAGFRTVIAGGELLRGSVAARAQRAFGPDCRVFNEYGPTETTVGCMARLFRADEDADAASVPIGVPTANTRIHLLDAERRFVAPGAIGEMYLAGDQLARGYRGRPDLTAERFVTLADGTRAYRSGDLARQLPSGELESCGRNDEQVKVRGHRVEPAEIARVLEQHPGVVRAVVVDRTRRAGADGVLCGYVVPAGDGAEAAELTGFAARRLPSYMVPAAVVVVADIPYTANGKVDAARLPDPFGQEPAAAPGPEERDPVERAVAGIWARMLGVETASIGADTDFHLLGGTSVTLLAMLAAVCAEIVGAAGEREFMSRLDLIVRTPTPGTVAELARAARR